VVRLTIEKLNGVDKIFNNKEIKPVKKTDKLEKKDSIEISDKAKEMALREKYIKIIKESPEIDNSKKIEELKKQISEPDYITQKLIDDIARRIAESLGLL